MTELGYRQFEEPCQFQDHDATRQVNAAIPIPVSGGEQDYDLLHWQRIVETREVDIIQPDLGYCGGLARTLRVCRLAAEHGLTVMPHAANLSFMTLMAMHLMCAIDNAGPYLEFTIEDNHWLHDVFHPALVVEDGEAVMPAGPGWGVSINESWLSKATHRVSEN
jgi:L-alanine-DL-glutamate epimerase-like enolase superfamily enzyme